MLTARDQVSGPEVERARRSAEQSRTPARELGENRETPETKPDWPELVRKIQAGEPGGMEELYRVFSRGVRFYLCRQLGPQELDDKVHDTFLIVIQAIRRGDLREPERLMGFVRTIVRRQVAAHIDHTVQTRKEQVDVEYGYSITDARNNPEEAAIAQQRREIMTCVLRGVSRRDREILTRFYLLGESQEKICSDMDLTETQFRLLKSRAKARFGELGKQKLQNRIVSPGIMRQFST